MNNNLSQSYYEAELQRIGSMLFALSELIKFQNREPSLDEERFNCGLADLILGIADEIDELSDTF